MSRHYVKSDPIGVTLRRLFTIVLRVVAAGIALASLFTLVLVAMILLSLIPDSGATLWYQDLLIVVVLSVPPLAGLLASVYFGVRGYRRAGLGAVLFLVALASMGLVLMGFMKVIDGGFRM